MFDAKLKELRTRLKLTQSAVADVLGINQDAVSKIEHGKRDLTSLEIFKLSKKYGIPIGYFFGEVNMQNLMQIYFKATKNLPEKDREKIPLFKEIARKQYDIEDVLKIKRDKILRKYPIDELDRSKIREIALMERKMLGFDEQEPIQDLLGLLRSHGVKILQPILEEYMVNGMFFALDKSRFFIIINGDNSPSMRNFALAHEYGHYLINRDEAFNVVSMNIENQAGLDEKEKIAHAFAAEFLMPQESFKDFVISDESLTFYLHDYKISRTALIYRLDNLGRINSEQKQYYLQSKNFSPIKALKKLEKLGLKSEEVKHNEKVKEIKEWTELKKQKRKTIYPLELMTNEYKTMVLSAYERGLITFRKVADYLFMDEKILEKILKKKEVAYEY